MMSFLKDKRGVSMLVYFFMLTAITLMLILLQFNTILLLNEKSKIDNIGDEAVTTAVYEIYRIAKEELETTGIITDSPIYNTAIETKVRNIFSEYGKNITELTITISGRYLTIEGVVTSLEYKNPDYHDPKITPVNFKFKNTAIIKNIN